LAEDVRSHIAAVVGGIGEAAGLMHAEVDLPRLVADSFRLLKPVLPLMLRSKLKPAMGLTS